VKLSEAILLGSTVVTPKAGALRFSGENAGCALGMAAVASGCTFTRPLRQIPVKDLRTVNIEDIYGPWLLRMVICPCGCSPASTVDRTLMQRLFPSLSRPAEAPQPIEMRIKDVIAHLFDQHVMQKRDWSLDQLVAWVERWEPSELAQATMSAHASRRSHPQPPSPDSDDSAEWQKTREAFQAKADAKRRRGPTAG